MKRSINTLTTPKEMIKQTAEFHTYILNNFIV